MIILSLYTGVPGFFSGQPKQDDLICMVDTRLGSPIPVSASPNVVTHVYLPPWRKWERREGNSFAFRGAVQTHTMQRVSGGLFRSGGMRSKLDTYWPGILIRFNPGDGDKKPDSATLVLRANRNGADYDKLNITEPGWWTLGMSFPPNGEVQYYAHAGVEPLTEKDHLATEYPYGSNCEQFETFFFDVLNGDNGNWSTPWVVDDSFVYWNRKSVAGGQRPPEERLPPTQLPNFASAIFFSACKSSFPLPSTGNSCTSQKLSAEGMNKFANPAAANSLRISSGDFSVAR